MDAMLMVLPLAPTVPHVEVVKPAAKPVIDGVDQPAGTTIASAPLVVPPAGTV
jgi:hypothetical protein